MISKTGEHSRRMNLKRSQMPTPDLIILMPCGFDTNRTIAEYNNILRDDEKWNELEAVKAGQIYAVDANSFFSKPSIRTIEGIEILSKIMNPSKTKNMRVSENAYVRIA